MYTRLFYGVLRSGQNKDDARTTGYLDSSRASTIMHSSSSNNSSNTNDKNNYTAASSRETEERGQSV